MALHTELTPTEAADRLALRELFDEYAHCADRRDAEGQKALFTDDAIFAVYMEGLGFMTAPCVAAGLYGVRVQWPQTGWVVS